MHLGQVRLQFSWPPLFFCPHCLYRSAVCRALIPGSPLEPASRSFSFRPAPALPVLRPSPLRPAHAQGAPTRSQIQSRRVTLAPMVDAVNLGLTELATISSYNMSARNAAFFDDPRLRVPVLASVLKCVVLHAHPKGWFRLLRRISLRDKWIDTPRLHRRRGLECASKED
jgi:hypothetical protein